MQLLLKRFTSSFQAIEQFFSFLGLKPNQLTKSLSDFYTSQSVKRTNTRKKERPEFEIILETIKAQFPAASYELLATSENELSDAESKPISKRARIDKPAARSKKQEAKLHIVELGCGDGRFAQYLDEKLWVPFTYIGIDAAGGLIQTAKERSFANQVQFFVGDMSLYVAALEQESVDIIISMASIQHLHKSYRQSLWNNAYRVLKFQGLHITTNRSYSKRMFSKHWKSIIIGLFLQIFNHGTFGRNDLMIPFKTPIPNSDSGQDVRRKKQMSEEKAFNLDAIQDLLTSSKKSSDIFLKKNHTETFRIHYRFYHLYLLGELLEYAHTAGFVVTKSGYISSDGIFNDDRKTSRNTYVVARKDVAND